MNIGVIVFVVSLALTGCVSSSPPLCYNKALIAKEKYDIAVFKIEDGKYLAGNPFHTWADMSQFIDTSECDKLNP